MKIVCLFVVAFVAFQEAKSQLSACAAGERPDLFSGHCVADEVGPFGRTISPRFFLPFGKAEGENPTGRALPIAPRRGDVRDITGRVLPVDDSLQEMEESNEPTSRFSYRDAAAEEPVPRQIVWLEDARTICPLGTRPDLNTEEGCVPLKPNPKGRSLFPRSPSRKAEGENPNRRALPITPRAGDIRDIMGRILPAEEIEESAEPTSRFSYRNVAAEEPARRQDVMKGNNRKSLNCSPRDKNCFARSRESNALRQQQLRDFFETLSSLEQLLHEDGGFGYEQQQFLVRRTQ